MGELGLVPSAPVLTPKKVSETDRTLLNKPIIAGETGQDGEGSGGQKVKNMRRFKDKAVYDDMVGLLKMGKSPIYIAHLFNVDHTTIIYHAKKLGIKR